MTTLLKAIDENCLSDAQSTLGVLLQCILATDHAPKKIKLFGSFAKPSLLCEWAGLPLIDAEKQIIQVRKQRQSN